MKTNLKSIIGVAACVIGISSASAAVVTWDNGGSGESWTTGDNWTGTPDNTAPVSGVDSVVLSAGGNAFLNTSFTVGNGQSVTATTTVMRLGNGNLTLESGSSLNANIFANGGGSANTLRIEHGASATINDLFTQTNWDFQFVSDSAGVSLLTLTGNQINNAGMDLFLDLTAYDFQANGDIIPVIDYNEAGGQAGLGAFNAVYFIGGGYEDASVNLAYDLGGGNLGIAVTVVQAAPEPSSLALLFMGAMLLKNRASRKHLS